jgi:hypothetical protein
MGFPLGPVEFVGRVEDRDGAGFIAAAPGVVAAIYAERRGLGGDLRDRLFQGRLVALDLNDQAESGLPCDLEVFF